jgi:hypothetical protein
MEEKHVVPGELAAEGETIVELLREAAKAQGREADLYLLTSKSSQGFEPVTMGAAVLLIGSTSATWLTKKWVDAYLWPFVQSRIDKPSRKFLDWLGSKLPGDASGPVEAPK